MSNAAAPLKAPDTLGPAEPAKEIPEVSEGYRKAHKSYVLVSGLLASWELIGITLNTKEKWGVELQSPAGVPLVLFTLLLYSGYKMTIEWLQCDGERRKNRAAKIDFRVAHGIAAGAVAISLIQYLVHIRIADILSSPSAVDDISLGYCVWMVAVATYVIFRYWRRGESVPRAHVITISVCCLLGVMFGLRSWSNGLWHFAIAVAVGITFGIISGSVLAFIGDLEGRRHGEG